MSNFSKVLSTYLDELQKVRLEELELCYKSIII